MIKNNLNKKAQVSMFIIAALIIVVIIILVFLIIKKPGSTISAAENPQAYIAKCSQDSLAKTESQLIKENLYINLSKNFMVYYGKRVPYLCRSSQFYISCVNQEPMLIEKTRKTIESSIEKDSDNCFTLLVRDFESKGYSVKQKSNNLTVNFKDNYIEVNLNRELTILKDEETQTYNSFTTEIPSPLFNLMKTAQRIVDYESTYCDFNEINWQMNYPEISIKRFVTSDSTKVYSLTDKTTNKTISFAISSCTLPAGI